MAAPRVQYNATWSHGPVSGPINGVLGAVFIALLGRVLIKFGVDFPIWLPMAVAGLGSLAALIVGFHNQTPTKNIHYRISCWMFAGVWTTWTIHFGLSLVGFVVLVCGAFFAAALVSAFAPKVDRPTVDPVLEAERGMAGDILKLIVKFGNIKTEDRPTVRKLKDWSPNDAGSTWIVTGAKGTRFSWRTLREIQTDLASGLALPDGCPVQCEPAGTTQNEAKLHVSTRNYMAIPIDYPTDYSELTVMEEFSVGRFLDASPTLIELYQAAGLAAGQRGGGKTVLLQNMTASLVRCRDVIVWHIDLNGGGMCAPWTMPFALGDIQYAPVDWIATTPREALEMARAALRIAKDRKKSYQGLLVREGTDVLPVSSKLPLIMIIVDEAAEVTGDDAIKEAQMVSKALQEVQRIGRAMCVNVFFSTLRATSDYIPAGLKKGASLAFCTRVKDESELAQVFDWHKGIKPEDLTEPGQMFIQRGQGAVKMFKGYRLLPPQIGDIAYAVQPIRAKVSLDERALVMAGAAYRERWERDDTASFMAGLRGEDVDTDGTAMDFYDDPDREDPEGYEPGPDEVLDSFLRTVDDIKKGGQAKQAPPRPATANPTPGRQSFTDDEVNRRLAEFQAGLDQIPTVQEPVRPRDVPAPAAEVPQEDGSPANQKAARRGFILQILEEAGAKGLETGDIVRQTIAAGLCNPKREATTKEHLTELRKEAAVTQTRDGRVVQGWWWAV